MNTPVTPEFKIIDHLHAAIKSEGEKIAEKLSEEFQKEFDKLMGEKIAGITLNLRSFMEIRTVGENIILTVTLKK